MPQSTHAPINPADFVSVIDNSYFPLTPGTTFVTETETADGTMVDTTTVTRHTRVLDGVTCVAVSDIATVDGALSEKTTDYYAQDKAGNVWYFGEDTAEYENGKVVSTEGTWHAGINGAVPGIIMEANPKVGDSYNQEHAAGVAEDHAEVVGLNASVTVPYGNFDHMLATHEDSALEPTASEIKYYAQGIGFVEAVDQETGEIERLVEIRIDGTAKDDRLAGKSGPDVLHGHAGNDALDGGDDKVSDRLFGDGGNDRIDVRTADKAFGDAGNDTLRLFDNAGFGVVSGGTESSHNLARSRGDILDFSGTLDLTQHDIADRISGIETVSMRNGHGGDTLTLNAADVLDLGDGTFAPRHSGGGSGAAGGGAVRVDGNCGDRLDLTGGGWAEVAAKNAPCHYDVYVDHTSHGNAYVLVQDHVSVHIG